MKKIVQILFLNLFHLVFNISGHAQNLIQNGDFELGPLFSSLGWGEFGFDSDCLTIVGVSGPDFWIVTSGSPDRMVEGSICPYWDNELAQSGVAYIHIGMMDVTYIESGKTILLSPLQKGSEYKLSYYADNQTYSGIGIAGDFTRLAFKFNNESDTLLSPFITNGWQYYETIFVASANSTEMEIIGAWENSSANIDNISLEKISTNSINAYQPHVVVPTVFSPNGDGQNDVLYVRGEGVVSLEFIVYSRWGEKIFETTEKETGWDGTFKGKILNPAVFVYSLKATLINLEDIIVYGNITLTK